MELGKLGVWCFTDTLTPAQLTELAQHTERLGYAALWYPEALSYESFSLGSFLVHQTETLIDHRQRHSQHLRSRRHRCEVGQTHLSDVLWRTFFVGVGRLP